MEERMKVIANGREIEIQGSKEFIESIKEGGNFYVVAADHVEICAGCEDDYVTDHEDDVVVVDETTKTGNTYLIVGGNVAFYDENDIAEDEDEDDGDTEGENEDAEGEDDGDTEGEDERNHSSFGKKLGVTLGIVAVLLVAALLLFNVFPSPKRARQLLDHYETIYQEQGAKAISLEELDRFEACYKNIRIYQDVIRNKLFWLRFYDLRNSVKYGKSPIGVDKVETQQKQHDTDDDLAVKAEYATALA